MHPIIALLSDTPRLSLRINSWPPVLGNRRVGTHTVGPAEKRCKHLLRAVDEDVGLAVTLQQRLDRLVLLANLVAQKLVLTFEALRVRVRSRTTDRHVRPPLGSPP